MVVMVVVMVVMAVVGGEALVVVEMPLNLEQVVEVVAAAAVARYPLEA